MLKEASRHAPLELPVMPLPRFLPFGFVFVVRADWVAPLAYVPARFVHVAPLLVETETYA